MKNKFALMIVTLASLLLMITTTDCNLPSVLGQSDSYGVKAAEGGIFEWDGIGELNIPADALSEDGRVLVSLTGEEVPFPTENPFELLGREIEIDLGDGQLTMPLTMTMPLPDDAPAGDDSLIVARTYAPDGTPMTLGTVIEGMEVRFQVTNAGFYQLFSIQKPDYEALAESLAEIREPLTVPVYPQIAPDWCSPTALTMLAQYHEGSWPAGGTGSRWGETASWYLTGLARQPATSGNFFHTLLGAAGYNAPEDVRQDFTTVDMDVIIWNWNSVVWQEDTMSHNAGYVDMNMAENLYQAFRAFAESYFWGLNGTRRPVAWGSGMISHSRVLTGSDGTQLFYNEPGNGVPNVPMTWEDHHDAVMNSLEGEPEIIDTVVMLSEPRPEEARQGVIWLMPETGPGGSAVTLRRVDSEGWEDICYWYWDGSGTRASGYYYDNHEITPNPCASQPENPEFDHIFSIQDANYEIYYEFDVRNIGDEPHSYLAAVEIEPASGGAPILISHVETAILNPGDRARSSAGYNLSGTFPLDANIGAGRHTLRFSLWLDGVMQDIKYVFFEVESFTAPLPAMPTEAIMPPLATTTPEIVPIIPATETPIPVAPIAPTPTLQVIIIPTSEPTASLACLMNSPFQSNPADGAWVASLQPTLEWGYVSFTCWPESYTVQIATDANMTQIVQSDQTEADTFVTNPLNDCTTYYWRVAGMIGSNMGPWSDVWSFTTGDARSCGP